MRDRMWRTLGIIVFIMFFCAANTYASEEVVVPISKTTNSGKDFSVRAFFKFSPIVAGEAIDSESFFNTPEIGSFKSKDYDDIFDSGYGGGLEVAYRHNNWVSGIFGVAYEHFDGESFSAGQFMLPLGMPLPARAEVDDWDVVSIYTGAKLHLTGKKAERGWDPYCRFDIGGIYLSDSDIKIKVKANLPGGQVIEDRYKEDFLDSSFEFMCDVGVGLEYKFGNFGVFGEAKYQYHTAPDSKKVMGLDLDPEGLSTVPIIAGASYYF